MSELFDVRKHKSHHVDIPTSAHNTVDISASKPQSAIYIYIYIYAAQALVVVVHLYIRSCRAVFLELLAL